MAELTWHPHTETPIDHCTALIAADLISDEDQSPMFCLVGNVYNWDLMNQCWRDEVTGERLEIDLPFFWITEAELMTTIKLPTH